MGGIQRVESVVCCKLDLIKSPSKAPTTSPTTQPSPSPTTAPSPSPTYAPSPSPTEFPSPSQLQVQLLLPLQHQIVCLRFSNVIRHLAMQKSLKELMIVYQTVWFLVMTTQESEDFYPKMRNEAQPLFKV